MFVTRVVICSHGFNKGDAEMIYESSSLNVEARTGGVFVWAVSLTLPLVVGC